MCMLFRFVLVTVKMSGLASDFGNVLGSSSEFLECINVGYSAL